MSPSDKIQISLEVQAWQIVMNLLVEGPYKLAAPVIAEIQQQFTVAQQELQARGEAKPAQAAMTNGTGMARVEH